VYPFQMTRSIYRDDLPSVSVSRLRAAGRVTVDSTVTTVRLGDVEMTVAVTLRRFPNGGSWSLFLCPACGSCARTLSLLGGRLLCRWCCRGVGVRYRVEDLPKAERARQRILKLRLRLDGRPARLTPRPGRIIDRRRPLEFSLRRALIVERRKRLGGVGKALAPPDPDPSQ
jgi:hypothetical protein